jgi:hypothetical protein
MVSIDHFRQELLAQMDRAATLGRIDILIKLAGAMSLHSKWEVSRRLPMPCRKAIQAKPEGEGNSVLNVVQPLQSLGDDVTKTL